MPMKLRDLIDEIETQAVNTDTETDIGGICYDTRVIRDGELFIAIKGYQTDGHNHIHEAVQKGAVCIICQEQPGIPCPFILVKDSRKALALISAKWFGYPAKKLNIVGVTGTNGKTSVTNLIKHIIEKNTDSKVGLIGTNGNFIGERELPAEHTTPESYELHKLLDKMVLEGCRYAVMEVSSHALYLSRVYGMGFDVGVFTNLSPDHLDFHGTMDEYAQAKAMLFPCSKKSVINIDDAYAEQMIEKSAGPVITFAVNNSAADVVGKDIKLHTDRVEFCVLAVGSINRVELPVPAMFSVYNSLAAICAAILCGFDIDDITSSIQSFGGVKGRAEVITTGHDYTVLIDYAHTPDALGNIIGSVKGYAKGKVVTVFGCGGDRDKMKRPLMGQIAAGLSDYTIITSDNPRTENPEAIIDEIITGITDGAAAYERIENRHEAITKALDMLTKDDVLIIAGKGHETYQIHGREKIYFDDREVVAQHIRQLRVEGRKKTMEGPDI